jgi:signal transduction histidine kinase
MNPIRPDHPLERQEAAARWRGCLRARLAAMGVAPAPEATPDDVRRVRDADGLVAQFVRAARHSSGAVRAFASLVGDAHEDDADTARWLARIERATTDLDEFSARVAALRICDDERPTAPAWGEILARVSARCANIAPCPLQVIDRTRGPFRQRAELLGRMLFQLARNAMESSPRCGVVRLRVDDGREEGMRLFHVRVSDEGSGIDPSVEHSLWQPFVTSRRGHAGLGLAYVAAAAPMVGAVCGIRREANHTTVHMLVGEEGGLQWQCWP